MFFKNFQDSFSYYLCDDGEHANNPPIAAFKIATVLRNLHNHPLLLPLTGKDLRLPSLAYFERVDDRDNFATV